MYYDCGWFSEYDDEYIIEDGTYFSYGEGLSIVEELDLKEC